VKKTLFIFFILLQTGYSKAQTLQDSVVQLYGVIMTADSLRGIPAVTVSVVGQNRGTFTNDKGIFSIVTLKGDVIEFTSVGYKSRRITVPNNIEGNQYSMIQLMVTDTFYQPLVIIKPKPTPEQFARDFINEKVNDDDIETARKNNDEAKKRVLIETLPADGREAVNMALNKQAQRYYYNGQAPPQNLFSPIAWAQFIKAWKRGDFKRKR
jgi:CarboxypepD_reg-like domain